MIDHRIGIRYARALFSLAEARGELDQIERELTEAVQLVVRHPEIPHLLANTTLSREEKEDFIERVFLPDGFSRLLVDFFKVLVRKRRFQDLALIREKFHRLYEEKKGLQRVRVQAPIPLDETTQEKLKRVLEKKLNRTVYLEPTVNSELLGGLLLDFDGNQIDGSFRTVLQELKQRLFVKTKLI